jgi:hypothetical protein
MRGIRGRGSGTQRIGSDALRANRPDPSRVVRGG